MKLCCDSSALTSCGTTVSSYPTMPGRVLHRAQLANQVVADFLMHVAARHGAIGDGAAQIADVEIPEGLGIFVSLTRRARGSSTLRAMAGPA